MLQTAVNHQWHGDFLPAGILNGHIVRGKGVIRIDCPSISTTRKWRTAAHPSTWARGMFAETLPSRSSPPAPLTM